jgi:hypothetical protein
MMRKATLVLAAFLSSLASCLAAKDSIPIETTSEARKTPWRKQTANDVFLTGYEQGVERAMEAIRAIEKRETDTGVRLSREGYQMAVFKVLKEIQDTGDNTATGEVRPTPAPSSLHILQERTG